MTTPNPPGYPWQDGQILTAEALNDEFSQFITVPGGILTNNAIVLGAGSANLQTLSTLGTSGQVLTSAGSGLPPTWANASIYNPSAVTITGGTIDGVTIGSTNPMAINGTTITGSSTISGTQLVSSIITGTPPIVVSSTTQVANLNAETSGTSTNLSGGSNGSLPYQTGSGATTFLAAGSNTQVLTMAGGVPTWASGGAYNPAAVAITGGTIDGTSIGATTKSTGAFTTISATSTITPNTVAGIVGTTLGDNAQAGSVGEILTLTQTLVAGVLATNSINNVVQLALSAGCWLITGSVKFTPSAGATVTTATGGTTLTTSSLPSAPFLGGADGLNAANPGVVTIVCPIQVFNVTGTGNYAWLTAFPVFSGGQCAATGQVTAIRIR